MTSESGITSLIPATPRSARTRRSTFTAASRSLGLVARSSSPAAMFDDSAAKNPPPPAPGLGIGAEGVSGGAMRASSAARAEER
jgi:hypothetical protein